MLLGHLNQSGTYETLIRQEALLKALAWIRAMPSDQAPGIYELQGQEMFVNVHGYETEPRDQCRFESHRRYLDIQYCIEGGEIIDWQRSDLLQPDGAFDEERDLQFYLHDAEMTTSLHMTPGTFAIFFPPDAHRPRVSDGIHGSVRKLVVKIDRTLV